MNYPYDVFLAQNKKTTFSIDAHFVKETEEAPLKVFSVPFSRYRFNLIEDGKSIYANVPANKVAGLIQRTKALYNIVLQGALVPASESGSTTLPICFTTRFAVGTNKGKSPAEIILSDPANGKNVLNKEYKFLKENVAKFPKNQTIMDAIMDAAKHTPEELAELAPKSGNAATGVITILKEDVRPLERKKREDGKSLCYGLDITYEAGKNYPVTVSITQFYAPVERTADGRVLVKTSQMDSKSKLTFSMSLTLDNWAEAVEAIELSKNAFYMCNFSSALKLADAEDRKNRTQAAKEAKAPEPGVTVTPITPEDKAS